MRISATNGSVMVAVLLRRARVLAVQRDDHADGEYGGEVLVRLAAADDGDVTRVDGADRGVRAVRAGGAGGRKRRTQVVLHVVARRRVRRAEHLVAVRGGL